MTFRELISELVLLVDSGTEEIDDKAPSYINEALVAITQAPALILPSLKTVGTIDTVLGQNYVTFTTGYDSQLRRAYVNGNKISVKNSLETLFDKYNGDINKEGSVEAIALEGNILWYCNTPSVVETITFLGVKKPDLLIQPTDENLDIPSHLHRWTILPYAAELMFKELEQGEEEKAVNTSVQKETWEQGVQKLRYWVTARTQNKAMGIWDV